MTNYICTKKMFELYKDLNNCYNKDFNAPQFLRNYREVINKCWTRNQYMEEEIDQYLALKGVTPLERSFLYDGKPGETPMDKYNNEQNRIPKFCDIHNRPVVYYETPFETPMDKYKSEQRKINKITKQCVIHNKDILRKELFRELGYYNYYSYTVGAMLHLNM